MQQKLATYHALLAEADAVSNELETMDKRISSLSGRVLSGVAAQYGRESSEYEKAGGSRVGDRRRRKRQTDAEMATV